MCLCLLLLPPYKRDSDCYMLCMGVVSCSHIGVRHVHLRCVVAFTCVYKLAIFVLSLTYSKCILCVCRLLV